jgi:NAD+ synthase (glutamine-hydrolysing)
MSHMTKKTLTLALAQINCIVGDLKGNADKIAEYAGKARDRDADIVCFPEMALTGYPPEDLLFKPRFVADNIRALKKLAGAIGEITAVVGFVDREGGKLYNAAAVIRNGDIEGVYRKMFLPNYGVFDEKRYFQKGSEALIFHLKLADARTGRFTVGVNICEDIWHKEGPTKQQALQGAKLIININASPFHMGKTREREDMIRQQAVSNRIFIAYTNLVGGQDELVFDGQSMVVDSRGNIIGKARAFKEDLLLADLPLAPPAKPVKLKKQPKSLEPEVEVYEALVLGLRDYVIKNGFEKVVIGLSGGIDSSLVATLATDALGKDNVYGVFMPSRYSSIESEVDAKQLAENLGIKLLNISIEPVYKMYLLALEGHFTGLSRGIAEENLQARIRGNTLMAFSNKFGWLVLATGNKSEMSTGYATLYGDMAGGLAVIKDVPKTLVYRLASFRNSKSKVIPARVFSKEPTAELKPNQKDKDTLPPYETLDPILKAYIEQDEDLDKIVSSGFDKDTVSKVLNMVDRSEHKRRQSPPGIKITPRAFGRDRRMPITNKFRG